MTMQRWDPFDNMLSLRDAMDRLLQESFVHPAGSLFAAGRGSLPLDLSENENSYCVCATIPGVNPDDVQINISGNTLTIRGQGRAEEDVERQSYILRERRAVSFHRSVALPGPVNADAAEAHYENGVLTLTLPKAEAARPRQIKVSGSKGQSQGQSQGQLPVSGQTAASDRSEDSAAPAVGQQTDSQTNAGQTSLSSTGQGDSGAGKHDIVEHDIVEQASEESFPASDPPNYSPGPA